MQPFAYLTAEMGAMGPLHGCAMPLRLVGQSRPNPTRPGLIRETRSLFDQGTWDSLVDVCTVLAGARESQSPKGKTGWVYWDAPLIILIDT